MPAESPCLRLLIVEDHPDTAELLAGLLELGGHDVQIAFNVEEALRLAAAGPIDLVVSDVGLPDATGYELMRELLIRTPVIRGIAMPSAARSPVLLPALLDDDLLEVEAAGEHVRHRAPVAIDRDAAA